MRITGMKIIAALLVLIIAGGCGRSAPNEGDLLRVKSEQGPHKKKVIFLMVDSLMAQSIDEGIRQHQLPTLQFLTRHGQYYKDLVSSFPTMSVTIDSSMLTGVYPDEHGVPGLLWYSESEKRLVNYGTGPMEILRQGVNPVLEDALIRLNGEHLSNRVTTIHEDAARLGLKTGSINGLVYRGSAEHTLTIPGWIDVPTTLKRNIKVNGPELLTLGALSNPWNGAKSFPDGLTNKLGMNNDYAVEAVKSLIQANKLPDFLYVYLPDLDQKLHKKGPADLDGVKELDGQLQSMLQAFGSKEQALDEAIIVIAGDSGMTQIRKEQEKIDLPSLLQGLRVLRPGEAVSKDTDVILAVNETMAYVYDPNRKRSPGDLTNRIRADERIDIAAWSQDGWNHVVQGSGEEKRLRFRAGGPYRDDYGQSWSIDGDVSVLDLKIKPGDRYLSYGEYPDGLRRLDGALHSHAGRYAIVTSKPGYELADRSSPTHEGGGGHGSIRRKESLVPLIVCGTKERPRYKRMIDLKAYLLNLMKNLPDSNLDGNGGGNTVR